MTLSRNELSNYSLSADKSYQLRQAVLRFTLFLWLIHQSVEMFFRVPILMALAIAEMFFLVLTEFTCQIVSFMSVS